MNSSRPLPNLLDLRRALAPGQLLGALLRGIGAFARWFAASRARYLLLSMAIGLFFGSYFVFRYGGYWAEQDSQFFAFAIIRMMRAQTILYPESYSHGFAYPAWASSLSLLTGLSVGELLRLYTPLIGNLLVAVVGFAAFRRLLDSDRLGVLAVLTLFMVPEVVFTVSRGNHEKLTIVLVLLLALAVERSFSGMFQEKAWRTYIGWVVISYLTAMGLVSLNIIFGTLVLFSWTVVFAASRVFSWLPHMDRKKLRVISTRLGLMCGTAWLLAFLIPWYFYPPSSFGADLFRNAFDVVVGTEAPSVAPEDQVNPYDFISLDWVSPRVYTALTTFRWVLLVGSALTWIVLFARFLFRPKRVHHSLIFLLGLYAALALGVAFAILVDITGAAGRAANLQVRFFTYFTLFAVPLLAYGATRTQQLLARILPRPLLHGLLTVLVFFFLITSLLKATLDPIVSNNWIFYHPAEIEAINTWASNERFRSLWIGPEQRLWFAWVMTYPGGFPNENISDFDDYNPISAHALDSSIKEAYATARGTPLSPLLLGDRVYDNGVAQVFHRVPETPFQR